MGHVEASGIVAAGRREPFYYTDWCYNVPEWFEPVRKTRIEELPDSAGMGESPTMPAPSWDATRSGRHGPPSGRRMKFGRREPFGASRPR